MLIPMGLLEGPGVSWVKLKHGTHGVVHLCLPIQPGRASLAGPRIEPEADSVASPRAHRLVEVQVLRRAAPDSKGLTSLVAHAARGRELGSGEGAPNQTVPVLTDRESSPGPLRQNATRRHADDELCREPARHGERDAHSLRAAVGELPDLSVLKKWECAQEHEGQQPSVEEPATDAARASHGQ